MQIHISTDGPPIYQQIVDQVRFRIVSGLLSPGDEMPTIRKFAESLKVNPNTVVRAYRELEHEGLVEKRRTTGTFVSQAAQTQSAAQRRKLITPHLDKLLIHARQLGIESEDLLDMLRKRGEQFPLTEDQS